MDSNVIYYLYLKTHNVTGLKYIGSTKQDPYIYQGSGLKWKNHLKKHGRDVTTKILGTYTDKEKLKTDGQYYSYKYNIVESNDFANLTIEEGQGGNTWDRSIEENRERMRVKKKTTSGMVKPKNKTHREKLAAHLKEHNKRVRSKEEITKLSEAQKKSKRKCPNCDFRSTLTHVKRHLNKNVCGPIREI
jgi:hypothetical protein